MEIRQRQDLTPIQLPGRIIQNAVGKEASIESENMTVGFAAYSARSGQMQPHHHDEESIYVIAADRAYMLHGPAEDSLGDRHELLPGMILHFDKDEWHVFRYEEGGFLDILFIYGKTDDLRPEKVVTEK